MAAITIGQAFGKAVALHQAGHLAQAEAIYLQILAQVPRHADALHLLGLIAVAKGHPGRGAESIRRAIAISPEQAVYHANLGVALHRSGEDAAALVSLEHAATLDPKSAETLCNLGEVLHSLGRSDEAIARCREALMLRADSPEAHHMLGVALAGAGKNEQAVVSYGAALALRPGYAEAHNNLGCVFLAQERLDEALECFRRAVALRADYGTAHKNLGRALAMKDRAEPAIASFRRALELQPEDAEAHTGLGTVLVGQARWDEAIQCFRRVAALKPGDADAWNDLGNALVRSDRNDEAARSCLRALELKPDFAEACGNLGVAALAKHECESAIAYFQRALELKPDLLEAHANLGACFLAEGRFEDALAACRRALEQDPDFAPAHWNLSHVLLLQGHHEAGWREYEWRWQCPPLSAARRDFSAPQWDGTPAPGRTILLHAEQGFGDAIQFLRYVPWVRERAGTARMIVECMSPLVRLAAQSIGKDVEIIARDDSREPRVPLHDFQVPFLSLPLALGLPEPRAASAPYLYADDALRRVWRQRLAVDAPLRVGIAWEGNPAHRNHRRRSIPFGGFAGLLRVPGVAFYRLQPAADRAQSQQVADAGIFDFTAEFTDFADTAALMAELDLVITVDTVSAHLAGALGLPVWTLLPFVPDWRWGLEKEDTPWYPSMWLFRQPRMGDWKSVILRVADELNALRIARGTDLPR